MVHELAHEVAGGRWLLTGGGGYELVQVVPRSWTHLLAIAAGDPVDPARAVPGRWRDLAADRTGEDAAVGDDGRAARGLYSGGRGARSRRPVDASIINTCRVAFPWHGLHPPM